MAVKRALILSMSSLFMLTGCGDGYELVKTNTMFPYGNERTAGSGVAYVLAKMLPKKELKLEPVRAAEASVVKSVTRDWKPEVLEILPQTNADQLFLDDGKK